MRAGDVQVADSAHPLVKLLASRLYADRLAATEIEASAGFAPSTFYRWFQGERAVMLQNIEAALNAVGYAVKGVPMQGHVRQSERQFFPGNTYGTRSGFHATVETEINGVLIGSMGRLTLEWNLSGQRLPAGGQDPSDLMPPTQRRVP